MHTARIPPVDPTPATITAVLAIHAGHICPSCELLIRRLRLARTGIHPLRASAHPLNQGSADARFAYCFILDVHTFSTVVLSACNCLSLAREDDSHNRACV